MTYLLLTPLSHSFFLLLSNSCIVLPDPVGVGSSGAVLGMLASWIVWILFRWYVLLNICLSISIFLKFLFLIIHSIIPLDLCLLNFLWSRLTAPCHSLLSFLYSSFSSNFCPLFSVFSLLFSLSYVYRKKIPEHCRKKRNCQMSVVVLSVVITLATSAAPFVDWYAIQLNTI